MSLNIFLDYKQSNWKGGIGYHKKHGLKINLEQRNTSLHLQ